MIGEQHARAAVPWWGCLWHLAFTGICTLSPQHTYTLHCTALSATLLAHTHTLSLCCPSLCVSMSLCPSLYLPPSPLVLLLSTQVPPDAMLPDYELPDISAHHAADGGVTNNSLERIGRYAQEHGMYRVNELFEDDRDNCGE